ncbi:hypothetical protein Z517_07617 [Fonsecaea pedrosoi CBS 271.37]|uniref:Major facilitator superfamily (MFS) profile domain-containing protein n=1 Tax=Fonsecaea pedrosoi CBS 271.37 TaxID=1442368 RepID=A0A0D2GZ97_9EURO|nr:uncharacterized protein Z517_07617 [Fonsecaea pedrosoi CBS 271.37]KIW77784.1 hypothetical protein Z517_07617 [Fonsecaea pedrosoi CBS 271.37]
MKTESSNIVAGEVRAAAAQSAKRAKKTLTLYNVAILCYVGLGSASYGYAAAVIGNTVGQPSFIRYFDLDTRSNGDGLIGAMNGLFQAGGFFGALITPWLSDRWGRKSAIAWGAVWCIVSGAFMAGSVNIGEFILFRFVSGLGANLLLAAVPIWMSEVVPAHFRGSLVYIHSLALGFGYLLSAWIGFGFFFWKTGGSNTWRPPLALQCVWPLLLLLGLYWIPESPRWLVMKDRSDEAKRILLRLHANPDDPDNTFANTEFYQIHEQIALDRHRDSSWRHLFRKPSYRKRCLIAMGTTAIIECCGGLVINNYGPILYANLGFSQTKQLLYPAAWLTFATGMNAVGVFIVDFFPRNRLLAFGVLGCVSVVTIEAAIVANFVPSNNHAALSAAVAVLFLFELFYGPSIAGTQFCYLGEIFPNHVRAKGVALGVSMISLMNVVWLQAAPTAFKTIGWKYYLCFIITGGLGGIVILFYWPDTRGIPLEEIGVLFGDEAEIAVFQADIQLDHDTKQITTHHATVKVDEA